MNGASGNAGQDDNAGRDGSGEEPQGPWSEQDHEDFLPGMAGYDLPEMAEYNRPPSRGRTGCIVLVLISALVIAVVVGAFAVKAWPRNQNTAALRSTAPQSTASPRQNNAGFHPTGQSPAVDAEQVTAAFLRAWSSGAIGAAAGLTDDPAAARAALTVYGQDLHLRKLTGTVVSSTATSASGSSAGTQTAAATGEAVTYSLSATVAVSAAPNAESGTWSYHSVLTAYRVPDGTGWLIGWDPSVVAPNLTGGQHLATILVPPQGSSVTDSAGNVLSSSYSDPGLANIATRLAQHAPTVAGTPGLSVQIEDSAGGAVPDSQATVTPPEASRVTTTISPRAERAALKAVAGAEGSAIVVLQPSTGYILAVANNAQFNDFALTAEVAPGSTMKIITSTALINSGLTSENSPVACPATYTVQGITYRNDQGESEPAGTPFSYDFAKSCNNAFSQWWTQLNGQLASTAKTYYGLDQPWNIGFPGESATTYFNAPADASGSELAQEAFGEGQLTASPLAMASVAATVESGQFRQPVLVPGTAAVSASPLPTTTDEQLKDMMRDVVTEGTAAGIGLGPDVYAKTGTAAVQGKDANSWMVAFDPDQDVAIAALVVNAGYGAQAAGPEVKAFFDGY